ncbi:hypothetical protein BDV25DRAFT_133604 [Aspergillus avenaceus]|uniref:Zn(2)-C6 fungal-type domain-containing protein n=1 Tax=Aspergillus avenaceus TaxID=36643 RepID=A0A5N6THC1_ASPAV|nr:hypothetical protein BDV25DRAFT_133604 [Aspergillus avenaceus]
MDPIAEPRRNKKQRAVLSCIPCHFQKIKCNHVRPCSACCVRGRQSKCEYTVTLEDRWFIEQAHLLRRLQQRRNFLEQRILALLPDSQNIPVYITSPPLNPSKSRGKRQNRSPKTSRKNSPSSSCQEAVLPKQEPDDKLLCLDQLQSHVTNNSNMQPLRLTHTERSIQSLVEVLSSNIEGNRTTPLWLEQAIQLRASSPLLCAAIEATSFILTGKLQSDPKSMHAGLVRYTCALRLAGTALRDPTERLRDEVFVAITLFGMIEMYEGNSTDGLRNHQQGGLDLLYLRTPSRHCKDVGHSIYVDMRLQWIISSILHRRTFLTNEEWKTIPWSETGSRIDKHDLFDIAADIPGLWRELDRLYYGSQTSSPCGSPESFGSSVEEQAEQLAQRLQEWRESQNPDTLPTEALFTIRDDFPVFETQDPQGIHKPRDLVYPNAESCATTISYWSFYLAIARGTPLTWQYEFACNICRSMRFCVQNFPFALAYLKRKRQT